MSKVHNILKLHFKQNGLAFFIWCANEMSASIIKGLLFYLA